MRQFPFKPLVLFAPLVALCCFGRVPVAQAISWTGDITLASGTQSNPTAWTSSTNGCIGFNSAGTLTVQPYRRAAFRRQLHRLQRHGQRHGLRDRQRHGWQRHVDRQRRSV